MAGQTINDRLLAARHSLAGQGLAKSVCKATTEELIGPKKKHLDCKFIIEYNNVPCKPILLYCTVPRNVFYKHRHKRIQLLNLEMPEAIQVF